MVVKVKRIGNGILPRYQREGDACMDCYARLDDDILLGNHCCAVIPLGFALELPGGYEAVIRPRSGLTKEGVLVQIGTVDSNYRGEVMATVTFRYNNMVDSLTSDQPNMFRRIKPGERICQLAIREAPHILLKEVDELSTTERGTQGFGSSGSF